MTGIFSTRLGRDIYPEPNSGCWLWGQKIRRDGYGQITREGKTHQAHRYVYAHVIGEIPDGLVLDHLCRNRSCVNPDHLEPVTQAENTRRAGKHKPGICTHCGVREPGVAEGYCVDCRRAKNNARSARSRARNRDAVNARSLAYYHANKTVAPKHSEVMS